LTNLKFWASVFFLKLVSVQNLGILEKNRFIASDFLCGGAMKVTTDLSCENLSGKLKRERVEACLNCKRFVVCNEIGQYEECDHFEEIEGTAWVITKFG
jgi:hypothetical protein